MQALHDAALGEGEEQREALLWFAGPHFRDACDAASMMHERVQALLRQILEHQDREQRQWTLNRVRERMHMMRG